MVAGPEQYPHQRKREAKGNRHGAAQSDGSKRPDGQRQHQLLNGVGQHPLVDFRRGAGREGLAVDDGVIEEPPLRQAAYDQGQHQSRRKKGTGQGDGGRDVRQAQPLRQAGDDTPPEGAEGHANEDLGAF